VLDHVAKTGERVEVTRGDVVLFIARHDARPKRRGKRTPRTMPNLIAGNPADLVHIEWPTTGGRDL